MFAVDYKFPTPPCLDGELNETISFLAVFGDVKFEQKECCFSPSEKFTSFIEHYSEFNRLIQSLCYVFRVIKACAMKDNE